MLAASKVILCRAAAAHSVTNSTLLARSMSTTSTTYPGKFVFHAAFVYLGPARS
jgi:hypothetical protein